MTASKPDPNRHAPQEVDAYLAGLPDDQRSALERVRTIVRETAPDCTERVSYRVPIFRLHTDLVGMGASKNHCSLFSMSPSLMDKMADQMAGFRVSGATVHFTPERPMPHDLVTKIVCERMKEQGANG